MLSNNYTFISNAVFKRVVVTTFGRSYSFKYEKPEKVTPCKIALDHFDSFYKSIFQSQWPSIRLGLLSKTKKLAVVNNFGDTNETEKFLKSLGSFDLREYINIQKSYTMIEDIEQHKSNMDVEKAVDQEIRNVEDIEDNEFYPPQKQVIAKAKFYSHGNNENKKDIDENSDFIYDPEETLTSLETDLSKADLDLSRLILPNSEMSKDMLNDFVPVTKLRGLEEYISESEYYKYYKVKQEISVMFEDEVTVEFPDCLSVYCFDRGDITSFPPPKRCINNVYAYLPMDGSDLLSVLALNLDSDDKVLDVFPYSGNKSFCVLQSLRSKMLTCNQNKIVENLFRNYLYDYSPFWKDMFLLTSINLEDMEENMSFNKILLDVPCSNDKQAIHSVENNYFAKKKLKQRFNLPSEQVSLLVNAIKLVEPGGVVIYTTTTISPIENDGVVSEALRIISHEMNLEVTVKNLMPAFQHMSGLFRIKNNLKLKYGILVLPFLPSNFGPRYICKIEKK